MRNGLGGRAGGGLWWLTLVFGGLLWWSVPAHALTQRGHLFGFSFGSAGAGAGQLSGPSGVALSEETGDVYVVDSANSRVERFGPRGEFIAAWGVGREGRESGIRDLRNWLPHWNSRWW